MKVFALMSMILGTTPTTPAAPEGKAPAAASAETSVASVLSASGKLRIEVLAPSVPLRQGLQRFHIRVSEVSTGKPVEGLTLSMQPWMPAMGHGIPETPRITSQGPGNFEVSYLNLYMSGDWELRFSMSGAVKDQAVVRVKLHK